MGKLKIDILFCLKGIIWNLFFKLQKSSTFHMAFVQIAEFDWLPGLLNGLILEKVYSSEIMRWMKLLLYVYVHDIILYINDVLLGKNSGFYGTFFTCCGYVVLRV